MSAAGEKHPARPATPCAVIFGCSGQTLNEEERRFFRQVNPWGFILFSRNCHAPDQIAELTAELRACVERPDAPVLIDQEGGVVARLKPPHWRASPPPARFGELYRRNPDHARLAAHLAARLIANDLTRLGITINCAPVLDLPARHAHPVIGSRALAQTPRAAAELGRAFCEGLAAGGVTPVIKHIPGHGRARVDSHEALPVVEDSPSVLEAHDFAPFRALADQPMAMTAHIIYAAFDPKRPATLSPEMIENVIRGRIGFRGLLISDAIEMRALDGKLAERAQAALAAGCDVVLHCSGKLAEMREIAAAMEPLSARAAGRVETIEVLTADAGPFDAEAAAARLDELVASSGSEDNAMTAASLAARS